MKRFLRDFRLIPVVLFATVCLLFLKLTGIVLDGGYTLADFDFSTTLSQIMGEPGQVSPATPATLDEPIAPRPKPSWAQEMFNFPDVTGSIDSDKQTEKKPEKPAIQASPAPATKPAPAQPAGGGTAVQLDANRPASPAERAILERLGERRQELDARARELEIRENLLKSAEKRLDGRVNELKESEQQLDGAAQKKEEAEAQRLKGLVTMYENMRAKDAAKIFDRLEMRILVEVVSQINPRRMSDIMAQMQPDMAERLTVELANRATGADRAQPAAALPKIEGRPR